MSSRHSNGLRKLVALSRVTESETIRGTCDQVICRLRRVIIEKGGYIEDYKFTSNFLQKKFYFPFRFKLRQSTLRWRIL